MGYIADTIKEFNDEAGWGNPDVPTVITPERVQKFMSIISEEVQEGGDITFTDPLDTQVQMADWLGDMIVYCMSEAFKLGLPIQKILGIIVTSNLTRINQGKQDERGKWVKGCEFIPPEPVIKRLLEDLHAPKYSEEDVGFVVKVRKGTLHRIKAVYQDRVFLTGFDWAHDMNGVYCRDKPQYNIVEVLGPVEEDEELCPLQ
jgi:hypothetical protein